MSTHSLITRPPLPERPRLIFVVGAGGIVETAHLPAYRKAGLPVMGITDLAYERAERLARQFGVPHVYADLAEMVVAAPSDAVWDVAVPARATTEVLARLPRGAPVLVQKPLGETLGEARKILALCREREFVAAVNFQLRFAPVVLAARDLIDSGAVGTLCGMEVRITADTPWQLWPFLFNIPRMEIIYHSLHYLDLVRSFLGEPAGVYAKTVTHPEKRQLASTRTAVILDYGDETMVNLTINHDHAFGPQHQESYVKWEGTRGAIWARLGLMLDYPRGVPDAFEYCLLEEGHAPAWRSEAIEGNWFPDAFAGIMSSLQRFVEGSLRELPTAVEDAVHTMALVEACYESSARGASAPGGVA